MGFFDFLANRKEKEKHKIIPLNAVCVDMDGVELQLREIAFYGCCNLIANIIGLCKMRQFKNGKEVEGTEFWLWNYEPNKNQNASAFWHKLVYQLYKDGEALIIDEPYGQGIVIADSFGVDKSRAQVVYRSISVDSRTIERLSESKVMHIVLNNKNMSDLIGKMQQTFLRLMSTAMNNYQFNASTHWKVHIAQSLAADDEWMAGFTKHMEKTIKPFLQNPDSVLPEVEDYIFSQVSGSTTVSTAEIRELYKTIWAETARAMLIPGVLIDGSNADTSKAEAKLLTDVIDPIATQITQEANRKRYSFEDYKRGDYVVFDTSTISHYDLLNNAANIEKLVGTGIWSVNEIRDKLGDTPIDEDWADKHLLTKNIGSVQDAEKAEE